MKQIPFVKSVYRLLYRKILKNRFAYFLAPPVIPVSEIYGFDRGKPIDRYYIENFLKRNADSIKGSCLELLNDSYTKTFGAEKVTSSVILDIDEENKKATLIADLRNLRSVADSTFDCIILTQVLQYIDDLDSAISECHRTLKDDGVILATMPSLGRIDCSAGVSGDYWRFTEASAKFIFKKRFKEEKLTVNSFGNVKTGMYFLAGFAQEDISRKALDIRDLDFPMLITVKAIK